MKYKWTYEGNKSFRQILIILSGEIFVGWNYSSGEICVTFEKIRHFRPIKFRPIRYSQNMNNSLFTFFYYTIVAIGNLTNPSQASKDIH